jgi:hypothetical protein
MSGVEAGDQQIEVPTAQPTLAAGGLVTALLRDAGAERPGLSGELLR